MAIANTIVFYYNKHANKKLVHRSILHLKSNRNHSIYQDIHNLMAALLATSSFIAAAAEENQNAI